MSSLPNVRPGQVWADNDWRADGRTVRVDSIDGDKAIVTTLTNTRSADEAHAQCPHEGRAYSHDCRGNDGRRRWVPRDTRGKVTRVALRRFRPTSTGYRLVTDEVHP